MRAATNQLPAEHSDLSICDRTGLVQAQFRVSGGARNADGGTYVPLFYGKDLCSNQGPINKVTLTTRGISGTIKLWAGHSGKKSTVFVTPKLELPEAASSDAAGTGGDAAGATRAGLGGDRDLVREVSASVAEGDPWWLPQQPNANGTEYAALLGKAEAQALAAAQELQLLEAATAAAAVAAEVMTNGDEVVATDQGGGSEEGLAGQLCPPGGPELCCKVRTAAAAVGITI